MGPRFADWPGRATWITAVSLATGRRVVFGRDHKPTLGEAVAASCAVPGYFRPVEIDGERFVDGGAHSIMNLDLAAGRGLDLVIASAPMATTLGPPTTASDLLRLPVRGKLRREARQVSRSGTTVLVVAPNRQVRAVMGVNSMDVSRRPQVAKAVYEMVAANRGHLRDLLGPLS